MITEPQPASQHRLRLCYFRCIAGSPNRIHERRTSGSVTTCFACAAASPTVIALPLNNMSAGVGNWQTFSEMAFKFKIDHRAILAGLVFATVIGALSNDSGPLIFEVGFLMLLMATGYVRSRPIAARVPVS